MRVKCAVLSVALGALLLVSFAPRGGALAAPAAPLPTIPASGPTTPQPDQRTGEVIVKFRQSTTLGDVATALGDAHSEATRSTAGSGLVLVTPRPGQKDDDVIASLRARNDVLFAEPNHIVSIAATPTDPLYASYQWSLPQIGLPAAWDTSTGSASVIVAVVDTGVDASHPDLAGKITSGANAGYNFVSNNTNTTDDHFHGTFVASIVAMNTNNGQGGAGVCWACKIMPVKVLDNTGSGSTFNVAQGVDWAVSHGAKVINLSLGSSSPDSGLQPSVDNAWNAGVVVVAASGNSNGPVLYPAAYANVIAVGSNNQAGVRSSFSNFGPELDVMAPGEGVFGADCLCNGHTGYYATGSGTSFASPHVAGVVGLMISAGITDKNQIRSRLTSTATDMDVPGFDNNTGWGRINAAAAIAGPYAVNWGTNTLPSTITTSATAAVTVSFTNAGTATWNAGGANPVRFAYHWRNGACAGASSAIFDGVRTLLPADVAPSGAVTNLNASIAAPAAAGTYCLQYDLVKEGVTWFSWQGASMQSATVTVAAPPPYAVTWSANTLPSSITTSATAAVTVSFTNTGTAAWNAGGANPVRFAYHWRNGACAGASSAIFDGVRTLLPADVAPSGVVTNLNALITAPAAAGTYCLQYDLVKEGVTWFSWQGASMQSATVTATPPYAVTWGANTLPSTITASATAAVTVSFTNAGTATWNAGGANPVRFAYHWRNGACAGASSAIFDGVRTLLPADVAPGGGVANLNASIVAPAAVGTYCLQYDLVKEGVTWFSWQGAAMQSATVTVN